LGFDSENVVRLAPVRSVVWSPLRSASTVFELYVKSLFPERTPPRRLTLAPIADASALSPCAVNVVLPAVSGVAWKLIACPDEALLSLKAREPVLKASSELPVRLPLR
jgi:hypothetical protein